VSAAAIVVRNSDLGVMAYASGSGFFDEARSGQVDMVRAVRSPGSTLKPFVYGLGFERLLIHPLTIITDAPVRFAQYEPKNFSDEFHGDMTVRDALIRSVNTAAVTVLARVGADSLVTRLRAAGARLQIEEADLQAGLAIALGGCGTTLADLAQLYAALANGGIARPLRYVPGDPQASGTRLLSSDAAWAVTDILADNPAPDGFLIRQARDGGRRIAYKTGTSYSFRDAWAVGYDTDRTVAVWVGRPDGAPNLGAVGRNAAAPLLYQIMDLLEVPDHDVASAPPANSILAEKRVPARLQRLGGQQEEAEDRPLKILFPQPDSQIVLPGSDGTLPLIANGGRLPLFWYVDEHLLGDNDGAHEVRWRPGEAGQVTIKVIDSAGRSDSVSVWIE
jgi:penicillin-binding protein 1C